MFNELRKRHPRVNRVDRALGSLLVSLIAASAATRLVGNDLLGLPRAIQIGLYVVLFVLFLTATLGLWDRPAATARPSR